MSIVSDWTGTWPAEQRFTVVFSSFQIIPAVLSAFFLTDIHNGIVYSSSNSSLHDKLSIVNVKEQTDDQAASASQYSIVQKAACISMELLYSDDAC